MHNTLSGLHTGRRGAGTTIDRFRLNEVMSQIAFGGRRRRVYQRIVALSGVRPGDSVLDVGSSGGFLARKLAAAAGPGGQVTGVDPSAHPAANPGRHGGLGACGAPGCLCQRDVRAGRPPRELSATGSGHASAAIEPATSAPCRLADTERAGIREKTFADEAIKQLDFLKTQHGFAGPGVDRETSPGTAVSVTYHLGRHHAVGPLRRSA
jgi:hypothetical protein